MNKIKKNGLSQINNRHDGSIKKLFAWILIGVSIFIEIIPPLLDLIRREILQYGPAQAKLAIFGVLPFIIGVISLLLPFNPFASLTKYFASIRSFFKTLSQSIDRFFNHFAIIFDVRVDKAKARNNWLDVSVIIAFLVFSIVYTLGRWNGISPFVYLGSDASYISSYAAALDHPGAFSNDYFLSNQGNVDSYVALHLPVIRFLNQVVGSYGDAFLVLLPLAIFFKLLGFYILGKKLFNNRGIGLLLAIITFPIIYTGAWDYWGLLGDALPRNLFDIAFPWLIYCSIQWINQPKKWYLLSAFLGLLTYVHSISAGIIFGVISIVYLVRSEEPFLKRIQKLAINSGIYLALISPFIFFFTNSVNKAQVVPVNYQEKMDVLYRVLGKVHLESFSIFLNTLHVLFVSGVLPLAAIALIILLVSKRFKFKSTTSLIFLWVISLILIAVVIPEIERHFDSSLHLITLQMMLVRGLRYLPPLLFVFIFSAFFDHDESSKVQLPHLSNFVFACLLLISIFFTIRNNKQDPYFFDETKCLSSGKISCPSVQDLDAIDIVTSLNNFTTPQDSVLSVPPLSVRFSTSIRYQALRPMGYSMADVTRLTNDVATLKIVLEQIGPWNKLEHADPATLLNSYVDLASEVKANYLIVQKKDFPPDTLAKFPPVYENSSYSLIKIK